jgi:FkbM family methyltransferase
MVPALARIAITVFQRRVLKQTRGRKQIGRRGVYLELDLDTEIGLHVYRHGWTDDIAGALDVLLQGGDVVVDGGANIGGFTLVAASIVGPSGAVHAVEAAPATAALLRRSVALNPHVRVTVHELALAAEPGELDFTTFQPGLGIASFAPAREGAVVTVQVTTLDALSAALQRVDLVKLDVEGAELRALQGATRLLAEQRPLLLIEIEPAHLARQGASPAAVEALLTQAGYEGFSIGPRRGGRTTFVPLRSPWSRPDGNPNILAVPPERRARLRR